MNFQDLDLIEPLLRAVDEAGYTQPTPIQEQAIGPVLAGRDLLGCAQTGTGKTAAFSLPILQRLSQKPRQAAGISVLVLAPTRELAAQIGESFTTYGKYLRLTNTVIFGGVGQDSQVRAVRRGVDILVATPGRLLDLMGQGLIRLGAVHTLVLDEADRMLDMGFIRDVQKILAVLPTDRQTLFFSATMPAEVQQLSHQMLRDPVRVAVTPAATTVERIDQLVYFVEKGDKRALLETLLEDKSLKRVIVFSRTKHGANKVVQNLERARIGAEAIHGNKSQGARTRALENFKSGHTRVLVATDIAARGIDVDGISHVVNYDLPNIAESYVHRIGRTARAGADGIALAFCEAEERPFLRDIERLIRKPIPVVADHPFRSNLPPPGVFDPASPSRAPAGNYARPQQNGQRPSSGQSQGQRPQRPDRQRRDGRPSEPRQSQPQRGDSQQNQRSAQPSQPRQPPQNAQPPQRRDNERPQQSAAPSQPIVRDWW